MGAKNRRLKLSLQGATEIAGLENAGMEIDGQKCSQ